LSGSVACKSGPLLTTLPHRLQIENYQRQLQADPSETQQQTLASIAVTKLPAQHQSLRRHNQATGHMQMDQTGTHQAPTEPK
jgi:hypothetical protein